MVANLRSKIAPAIVLAGFVCALFGAPGVDAKTVPDRSSRFYEDALARFSAGEYNAAIIQLKNALQQDPANPSARLLLGRAYLRVGAAEFAERALLRARRSGAHRDLILIPLGRAYLLQRKYDEIFRRIRPGRRSNSIEAEVLAIRGRAHLALRQFSDAEESFAAAARRQPDQAFPLLGRARVRMLQGRLDEAETFVDKALQLAPKYSDAWYEKADIRRARRDFAEALRSYGKAIDLQPGNIPARLGRAATLIDLRRDQEAESDVVYVRENAPRETRAAYLHSVILTRAGKTSEAQAVLAEAEQLLKKRKPEFVHNHPSSLLLLGAIGYARGNYDESYQYLSRYIELDRNHSGARKLLGSMLLRKGNAWVAIDMLRPALRYASEDSEIYSLLGNAYMRVREFSKATEMLEKAAEFAPKHAGFRTQLGLSRIGAGQETEAVEELEKALSLKQDGSRPGLLLGMVHLRRGNYDKALTAAEAMLKKNPKNPFAHNLVGAARMGAGDVETARAAFERALEADPAYAPAYFNLARLDMAAGQVDAARSRYHTLLKIKPTNIRAMDGLARIALSQGKLDDAVEWLKRVTTLNADAIAQQVLLVELYLRQQRTELAINHAQDLELRHPSNAAILEVLGRALLVARKYPGAARRFQRMAELAGQSSIRLRRAAELQAAAQDIAGARETLKKAVEIDPQNLPSQIALIRFEALAKNIDTALAHALDLRKSHPESRTADVIAGDLLLQVRQFSEAVEAYNAALAKKKESGIVQRLYHARYQAGEKADALAMLESWVAENPKDIQAKRLMASAYLRAGRLAEAINQNERLLARLPDDPALLNNLAGLYQKTGDGRAMSYAEKAYKLAPRHPATLDTYGWILVLNGDAARGLELLRTAFTRAADNNEIRYHLAAALGRLGRNEEARDELRKALETGDEFDGAADARALLKKLSGD